MKIYNNIKNINQKLIFIGVLAAFLSLYSCTKDIPLGSIQSPISFKAEARTFFENVILPAMPSKPGLEGKKTPIWEEAKIKKVSVGDAVIVPIKYDRPQMIRVEGEETMHDLQKSSYLMIYRDKIQQMRAEWVVQTPMGKKVSDKFVGIISINEWSGKNIRSYLFKEDGGVALMQETAVTPINKK
ncbi:hypothetical protein [Daejeonella sp.]|uniref:hypothetical protein n=1 Tax=Daejeonella sp. TaxID=2805397 RepID=UPI0025C397E0|nr:hypothetical protein [Daejeonella sp.]